MNYYAETMYEYMEAALKFTVDIHSKQVIINTDVTSIDIKLDIYKGLKTWYTIYDNSRYAFPIRTIGGDATSEVEFAGDMYFMINKYRLVMNPNKIRVTGITFSDDYETPWLDHLTLLPIYPITVSNLALARQADLSDLNIPTATENADAVWDKTTDAALINTYGERMLKLLTVAKYLGLK